MYRTQPLNNLNPYRAIEEYIKFNIKKRKKAGNEFEKKTYLS